MYSQQELDDLSCRGASSALRQLTRCERTSNASARRQSPMKSNSGSSPASTTYSSRLRRLFCFSLSAGSDNGSARHADLAIDGTARHRLRLCSLRSPRGRSRSSLPRSARWPFHRSYCSSTFVGGVLATVAFTLVLGLGSDVRSTITRNSAAWSRAISAAVAAAAAWLHWRRFRVPITVAAGAASVAGIAVGLLVAALGQNAEQAARI